MPAFTSDYLKSQRWSGKNDAEIAESYARVDPAFGKEYQLIKAKSERYNNPDAFIKSFLNFKAYGDATYVEPEQNLPTPQGAFGVDTGKEASVLGAPGLAAKTASNFLNMPYQMARHPIQTAKGIGQFALGAGELAGRAVVKATGTDDLLNKVVADNPDETGPVAAGFRALTSTTPEQQSVLDFAKQYGVTSEGIAINDPHHPDRNTMTKGYFENPFPVATAVGGMISKNQAASAAVQKPISAVANALENSANASEVAAKQKFVRGLVREKQTPSVLEQQVSRTKEAGRGPFKKSVIEPSKAELAAEKAVMDVEGISPKNTHQGNYNLIDQANLAEARNLEFQLIQNDPLVPRAELKARIRNAVAKEVAENPALVGSMKQTALKLGEEMSRQLDRQPGKGTGILEARKQYDIRVKEFKPTAFDPATESAFTTVNRIIRQTTNDFLAEKAPSVGVKESLARQSALYRAMDHIAPKAATEANTAWQRLIQNTGTMLGIKNKAVQGAATVVGVGGLGAAAAFAPFVAGGLVGGYFIFKAGKFIASPKLRSAAAATIRLLEDTARKEPAKAPQITPVIQEINGMLRGELPTPPTTTSSPGLPVPEGPGSMKGASPSTVPPNAGQVNTTSPVIEVPINSVLPPSGMKKAFTKGTKNAPKPHISGLALDVVRDGSQFRVTDGFHRLAEAIRNGETTIKINNPDFLPEPPL